ncbi:MAG TPA: Na+/H+ antiporter NhaA [Acidimicrobiales bacterium]|nr:Na+/H+ antiporter NhaA [Acidimicrobiales bacterium]
MEAHIERPTARDTLPARSLPPTVRRFLHTEASGGIALVLAAVVAVVWANSPWHESYEVLWHEVVTLRVGSFGIEEDLRHFVNDGLMALFFLVVALEIKRELVVGDLRDRRVAVLPVVGAVGGMVVPAVLYLVVNAGEPGAAGWGVPLATDIAFAVGVLALLGPRAPSALKLFLLSLAIVDDIGAIVVIAVAYTDRIDVVALALAAACVGGAALLRWARVWWMPAYAALGVLCWLATYESGVHPTLAGVAFGLLAPARPRAPTEVAREWAQDLSDEPSASELREMTVMAHETVSVAERLQNLLHPLTGFVIVPIFALANAGVRVTGDALSAPGATAVAGGVAVGLLVGKTVGIAGASALAVRLRLARLPDGLSWRQVVGVGAVAGIGFTVSLFITSLAYDAPELQDAARLAVLATSVVAAVAGSAILATGSGRRDPAGATAAVD